jgi:integrase
LRCQFKLVAKYRFYNQSSQLAEINSLFHSLALVTFQTHYFRSFFEAKHNELIMGLTKQAKTLCKSQGALLFMMLKGTRYAQRNRVIALLSIKAGLRAKEIANLTWDMITDAQGQLGSAIHLRNVASKGKSGRVIPLNKELRAALQELQKQGTTSPYIITTERSEQFSPAAIVNLFAAWFRTIGLQGCSSHSGRRTFITNAARKISTVGGSLRDVQVLAGHKALSTTQRYIEADAAAQKKVVDLI